MWPRIGVAVVAVVSLFLIATRVEVVRDYVRLTFTVRSPDQQSTLRDPTLGGRTLLWKASLLMVRDRPVFGGGPASWQWYYLKYRDPAMQRSPDYAHNDVLQLAADYGLVGLALGLGVLGCFYWQAIRLASHKTPSDQRALAIGTLVATTIILIHSWFDFNLHILSNSLLLATLMGCVVAMDDPGKRFARFELRRGWRYGLAMGLLVFAVGIGWPLGRAALAHRHFLAGNLAKMQLDYETAVPAYERARAIDPENPDIHIHLGNVYFNQGLWIRDSERAAERRRLLAQAIAAYEQAVVLQPLDSLTMLRLARAYEEARDQDQALQVLTRAVEVDPNSAEVNLRLGKFYERIGELEKATAALEKSQRLTAVPNYPAFLTLQDLKEKEK